MNTNRKISFCKWGLLTLSIVCGICLIGFTFIGWPAYFYINLVNPFSIHAVFFLMLVLLCFPLSWVPSTTFIVTVGSSIAGWFLLNRRNRVGRIFVLIAFLPVVIASAVLIPMLLIAMFFISHSEALEALQIILICFISSAVSAGAIAMLRCWERAQL